MECFWITYYECFWITYFDFRLVIDWYTPSIDERLPFYCGRIDWMNGWADWLFHCICRLCCFGLNLPTYAHVGCVSSKWFFPDSSSCSTLICVFNASTWCVELDCPEIFLFITSRTALPLIKRCFLYVCNPCFRLQRRHNLVAKNGEPVFVELLLIGRKMKYRLTVHRSQLS